MIGKIFFPLKLYMIFFHFSLAFFTELYSFGYGFVHYEVLNPPHFYALPPLRKPKMLFSPPHPITPPKKQHYKLPLLFSLPFPASSFYVLSLSHFCFFFDFHSHFCYFSDFHFPLIER